MNRTKPKNTSTIALGISILNVGLIPKHRFIFHSRFKLSICLFTFNKVFKKDAVKSEPKKITVINKYAMNRAPAVAG